MPWGEEGILVGIGGGRNDTFSQLNIVDIYDLKTRTWTKQATDGSTPKYRVNPCAVVGSASDGSSHNIYFFGGQNLVPYGSQEQYNDMWILSVPSFSWIQVDMKGQSVPPARAGHTCELRGSEMIVIGGYVGQEFSCDSPGIYVFDAAATNWKNNYDSSLGLSGGSPSGSNAAELYRVPQVVIEVIGGDATGGATVTQPIQTPDPDSPVVTGKPGDYKYTTIIPHTATPTTATVTNSDGTVTTTTTFPDNPGNPGNPGNDSSSKSPNIGLIIGVVVAGIVVLVLLILGAAYLWYRRKIKELREASEKLAANTGHSTRRTSGDERLIEGLNGGAQGNQSATDLLGAEPTFWGVLLSPRRSLRVVNH